MKKIYCENCKHLDELSNDLIHEYHCESPKNSKKIDTWLRESELHEKPEILNANNDCNLFEKKHISRGG